MQQRSADEFLQQKRVYWQQARSDKQRIRTLPELQTVNYSVIELPRIPACYLKKRKARKTLAFFVPFLQLNTILKYSQTEQDIRRDRTGFVHIQNYTTLKLEEYRNNRLESFAHIQNYTTLKHLIPMFK